MVTARTLVGRDRELAALAGAWHAVVGAPEAGPVVALVTGEAGIGKTAVVAEALAGFTPVPAVVLAGAGRPDEPTAHDWSAQALSGLDPARLAPPRRAAYRALTQQDGDHTGFPPRALLRAGVDLVRDALTGRPGVLVAEDLHALDGPSLTLVGELARTVALPAMVLVTSRPVREAAEPRLAAEVLTLLAGRPGAVRLHPRPLGHADLALLLESRTGTEPDPAVTRAVHRRTGGNPFWVGELLATLGTEAPHLLADGPLPTHLAALVLARLDGEDDLVRTVANAAALLGERVSGHQLGQVCGLARGDVRRAVDRMVARGLLDCEPGGWFRFRHALGREAVLTGVPPSEHQQVHRRAAGEATRRGDDAALARHAAALGDHRVAVAAARRGAERALAEGRPGSAARLAMTGLTSLSGGRTTRVHHGDHSNHPVDQANGADGADGADKTDEADLIALTSLAARAHYAAGSYGPAREHAHDWLVLARAAGQAADQAAALRMLANVVWHDGQVAEQWRQIDDALALAPPGTPEWVRCLAARSQALMRAERHTEAVQAADDALAAGRQIGYTEVESAVLVDKGTALNSLGESDTGIALLEDARVRAGRDHDVVTLARVLNNLAVVRCATLPPTAAWRFHQRISAEAERLGLESVLGKITRSGVDLAVRHGHLDRARTLLRRRLPVETDPVERVVLAVKTGLLATERGDGALAARMLDRCRPDAEVMDQHWVRSYVALLAVAVSARTGTAARTLAALAGYRDCVSTGQHAMRPGRAAHAVRFALDGGVGASDARRLLAECLPGGTGDPAANGGLDPRAQRSLAQAECALAEAGGDDVGAVRAGTDGLRGERYVAHLDADTHLRLARCLTRLRRFDEAAEQVGRAAHLLARWAGWRLTELDRVRGMLDRTGALTPREVDVLRLLAQGQTNRMVARTLGISARTVAVHVSSLLAKTGCASRTEAALWAVRSGLSR